MKKPVWRPLLEGAIAKEAMEAAEGVAADIGRSKRRLRGTSSRSEASLAGGTAGIALLYAYLGQAGLGRRYESASRRVLMQAGDAVGSVTMAPSLYGGFAGIAWAVAHLQRRFSDSNGGLSTDEVDEALRGHLSHSGCRRGKADQGPRRNVMLTARRP